MDSDTSTSTYTSNIQNTENIVIIQLNVNLIRSLDKRHQLDLFLKQHKPHILLCSETHLNNKHKINFNKYNIYRCDRETSSGGGTAIFVNKNIAFERMTIPSEIKSFECSAIKIKTIDG